VDPIGLVTVRERGYLLALVDGEDRTYRLSRMLAAQVLPAPANRPTDVDLADMWASRSARFRAGESQLVVIARLRPARREELAGTALTIAREMVEPDGRLRWELTFQDLRHAECALWQLGTSAEVLAPLELREALFHRATEVAAHYSSHLGRPEPTSSAP
jgi:predicted DNA-binding transcriptional regulator YafY